MYVMLVLACATHVSANMPVASNTVTVASNTVNVTVASNTANVTVASNTANVTDISTLENQWRKHVVVITKVIMTISSVSFMLGMGAATYWRDVRPTKMIFKCKLLYFILYQPLGAID